MQTCQGALWHSGGGAPAWQTSISVLIYACVWCVWLLWERSEFCHSMIKDPTKGNIWPVENLNSHAAIAYVSADK